MVNYGINIQLYLLLLTEYQRRRPKKQVETLPPHREPMMMMMVLPCCKIFPLSEDWVNLNKNELLKKENIIFVYIFYSNTVGYYLQRWQFYNNDWRELNFTFVSREYIFYSPIFTVHSTSWQLKSFFIAYLNFFSPLLECNIFLSELTSSLFQGRIFHMTFV